MLFKYANTNNKISSAELTELLGKPYEKLIKFVVDIDKKEVIFGGEMHADAEAEIIKKGSMQENIWGANIYPLNDNDQQLEYTSLINIRPHQNNLGMEILSSKLRKKINDIIDAVIKK